MNEASGKNVTPSSLSAKPTGDDFETVYNKMITSKEYLAYDVAQSSFMSKLNYKGDDSVFKSEESLLGWISSNLSLTAFKDYSSAKDEYNNLKVLYAPVIKNHQDFFMATLNPELDDVFIQITLPTDNVETDSCGYKTSYYACCKGANKLYHGGLKKAMLQLQSNQTTEAGYQAESVNLRMELTYNISNCKTSLNLCQQGCD